MASSSAKAKAVPYQPPVPDDDDECDCPKCPPVGAPAWLATFADIATNLMAFFVLILGFAQFDEPSFKKFAGAMRDQFGIQMDTPTGDSVIDLQMASKPDDSEVDESAPGDGANAGPADGNAQAVAEALRDALAEGSLQVDSGSGSVTVKLPDASGPEAALALADAIAAAAGGQVTRNDAAAGQAGDAGSGQGAGQTEGQDTPDQSKGEPGNLPAGTAARVRGEMTELAMQKVFQQEIADGSLSVEQRDGKVFVTLGAGGSFQSGSSDLSDEARQIMTRIAETSYDANRTITVTGHTDNIPLAGGQYVDNFGLAAARAASVVRELVATGQIDAARISAVSKGEFEPVADNTTEDGRAKNRRIEIEIDYGD